MKHIKQFGLQRSGSNFFYWLNNKNTKNVKIYREGKHDNPNNFIMYREFSKENIIYVFHVRNIISWIYEYKNYRGGETKELINKWNEYNTIALDFIYKNNGFIIKHEDLIENPTHLLHNLSKKYKIELNDEIIITKKEMNREGSTTNKNFNADFYKNREYIKIFTDDEIKLIKENVNENILEKLKYKI